MNSAIVEILISLTTPHPSSLLFGVSYIAAPCGAYPEIFLGIKYEYTGDLPCELSYEPLAHSLFTFPFRGRFRS